MSKEGLRSFFERLHVLSIIAIAGCNTSLTDTSVSEVSFMLIDVGQGLSQILVQGNEAILFDMGPVDALQKWKTDYASIGKPRITAIVISHRDLDHSGGLFFLDSSISWSGNLVVSGWEDTAFLRQLCSNWPGRVRFTFIEQDDTIEFSEDCLVRCLWPPPPAVVDSVPVPISKTNDYSVVCLISHGNNRIMVTGDIDSVAQRLISRRYTIQLRSDIVVIPHHGSASSVYPLYYGYIRPFQAAISYGEGNPYDHPSGEVINMLAQLGIPCLTTSTNGSLLWESNGFYWNERF